MKIYTVGKEKNQFKTNDRLLAFEFDCEFSWWDRIINWFLGYVKK